MMQVHPPDIIAQAADFPNRDNYAVFKGPDPLDLPEFEEMAKSLWGHLEDELASLQEVRLATLIVNSGLQDLHSSIHSERLSEA